MREQRIFMSIICSHGSWPMREQRLFKSTLYAAMESGQWESREYLCLLYAATEAGQWENRDYLSLLYMQRWKLANERAENIYVYSMHMQPWKLKNRDYLCLLYAATEAGQWESSDRSWPMTKVTYSRHVMHTGHRERRPNKFNQQWTKLAKFLFREKMFSFMFAYLRNWERSR